MDVLCYGSIMVDFRRLEHTSDRPGEPLRFVDKAVDLHVGGIPILAMAAKRMGFDVGLMGCVGRDLAGYGLKAYLAFVAKHKPKLLAIGYSGLLPKLDANGGEKMAEWIKVVQATGALVALDTHTVSPYTMLEKPVQVCDIFICNEEESQGISGLRNDSHEAVLAAIWSQFPPINQSRYRLLGLAVPEGVQLAYGQGDSFINHWISNPYYGTFTPSDLTGAGDYFRAGVYCEVTKQLPGFLNGRLNLTSAGQAGHQIACRYLQKPSIHFHQPNCPTSSWPWSYGDRF